MTTLLASDITLMDSIASLVLYGYKKDTHEMETWMQRTFEALSNLGLINDFTFSLIKSPHRWVFRVLIYTMDIYNEWIIFLKLSKVGDSHWLCSYKVVQHPKATNYIYPQEILDFIGTHKWRKDLGQI